MKKLFKGGMFAIMLLVQFFAVSQTIPPDATQLENIQITNNTTSTTATKMVVQENSGVLNTMAFSPQDNIFISKNIYYNPVLRQDNDYFAGVLNASASFSLNEKNNLIIIATRNPIHSISPGESEVTYKYILLNKGKGTYGIGGTTISGQDLELVSVTQTSSGDIENNPSTQTINTGANISGTNISAYVNSITPAIAVQSQSQGYVLFKVLNGTTPQTYLFLGDGGTYGAGATQTTLADFQLLEDEPETGFIKSNENLSGAKRKEDVLYGILDQYTGEEITLSKITSIPTGNSVDNIIYFQLGSEIFKRAFNQYNIQWFGALPNDSLDDTQQIQACINSCFYAGGGTVFTPHGIYTIAGPLVTSDNKGNNPNSQLYIPGKRDLAVGGTDTTISIKFIGSETPTMNASGFVDDKIAEINQGCIWQSTLPLSQATGVLPSVIGSKGDNPTYNFNVIDVMFEDMWIRTHHDATVGTYMTAFNMLDVAFSTFERCRADIDVAGFNSVEHQNLSIGIAPTKSNGGTTVVASNCTSYGYKIGYTVGEHAYYTNLNANFCVYAYDVSKAGHASMIVKALTQWNKHAMSFNIYDNEYGNLDPLYVPANFIAINEFVVEAINNGKWYVSTVDIVDPTNGIKGNCFFTKTVSGQGVFANTKLIKTGGLNMNDKHITRPIVVLEDDVERTYLKLRNPYATSGSSFGAIDIYGGNSITESTKFQIGQVSDGTAAINNLANKPLIITVNGKSLTLSPNGDASLEGKLSILNATASNHALAYGQLGTGWASYSDTVYTSGSPFSIATGTTSTLPNNAGTIINDQLPIGVTSFYNSSTSKITPENNGDYYVVTVRFKAQTDAPASGYFDFGIDIGGALGVQFKETKIFAKGANKEHDFTIISPLYTKETFLANGGTVKITSVNGNMTVYDISYQIDRTHKAK